MSDYRRWRVEGRMFFFTVVTHSRATLFSDPAARTLLCEKFRECQEQWPFEVNAIILQPDHLHAIWSLPLGDSNFPSRRAWIKKEFTKAWLALGGAEQPVSEARQERGDRGIWQPRYWEHTIDDEHDFERHFDYIHYNAVKHGLVPCPADWPIRRVGTNWRVCGPKLGEGCYIADTQPTKWPVTLPAGLGGENEESRHDAWNIDGSCDRSVRVARAG